jgi:hypothetical protein
LGGLLLESLEGILVEAGIVITIREFLDLILKGDRSNLDKLIIGVVSMVMVLLLRFGVDHVFTFNLDPFVHSVKRSTVEVCSASIVVVVDTFPWVESSVGVSNFCGFLGCGSISGVGVLSVFFVDDGLFGGASNFTGFLFSLIKSVIIILSRSLSSLHHLNSSNWEISHIHSVFKSINVSFSHDLSNRYWSWLWKDDFLIHTAECATFDEFNMSIRGMVETIDMSMGVSNSGLVSFLPLLSSNLVFLRIISLVSESIGNIDSLIHFTVFIFDGSGHFVLIKHVGAINESAFWEFVCTISVMDESIYWTEFSGSFSSGFLLGGGGCSRGFRYCSNLIVHSGSLSCTCDFSSLSISLSLVIGFIFLLSSNLRLRKVGKTKSFSKSFVISGTNSPGGFDSLSLTDEGKNCE